MGLWLEHRDENGKLVDRARFNGGIVVMTELPDAANSDNPLSLTTSQALELAKVSAHEQLSKRAWALRVESDVRIDIPDALEWTEEEIRRTENG